MQTDYKDILLSKFETRRSHEPTFSLRKFAFEIGLTPSNLSDIFKGRCGLSNEAAVKIAESLDMASREREHFLDLVESRHARSRADRDAALKRLSERSNKPFQFIASEREVSVVERWYYLATLEMVDLTHGDLSVEDLARRLSISEDEARDAFHVLIRAGLIDRQDGKFVRLRNELAVESPVPSAVVQSYHRQMLSLASGAMTSQSLDQRQLSSVVMTFDSSRVQEAKKFLDEMKDEFFRRFEAKENGDSVYALNSQFFGVALPEETHS